MCIRDRSNELQSETRRGHASRPYNSAGRHYYTTLRKAAVFLSARNTREIFHVHTVWSNVDHSAGSVAAQSPISGLVYESLSNGRFQVPVTAQDGQLNTLSGTLTTATHAPHAVQGH